jgi:hypothetical protein
MKPRLPFLSGLLVSLGMMTGAWVSPARVQASIPSTAVPTVIVSTVEVLMFDRFGDGVIACQITTR